MSMSRLATSDPEFYQYLQDNDRQLLEFEDSGSEDEELVEEESDRYTHTHTHTGNLIFIK